MQILESRGVSFCTALHFTSRSLYCRGGAPGSRQTGDTIDNRFGLDKMAAQRNSPVSANSRDLAVQTLRRPMLTLSVLISADEAKLNF
jgi:hypothetical protein